LFETGSSLRVEFDERLALLEFIRITTGIGGEVTYNHSFAGVKAAAQNGNSGAFADLAWLYVLDRNSQSFTLDEVVSDMRRLLEDPTLAGIFPFRSTPNIAFPVGSQSDLGENGFSMFERTL